MKLTDTILLEYNNGYYEIQHEKVAQETGNKYLSEKKTFAEYKYLDKYLAPYNISEQVLLAAVKTAKIESGVRQAKQANIARKRLGK